MRFYYYNDRNTTVKIYVNTLENLTTTLKYQTGDYVELVIPDGRELFIKSWNNIVLVTTSAKGIFD